ncbi:recombination-associated protein RdgC [Billgrantia desiderata]|uniref:recombination-associated protein RdgC n=1 Tax=Billgrantia desiderata TaxID=52021 RepID=UPI001F364C53|nr:recombination-associated protein RdgC [Halomonas desiderata]MCE8012908.1 recombination-associated protein RdgC [Halomonas desiderata]
MIRNARIFKTELPSSAAALEEDLAQLPFEEIRPGEIKRQGFVPHYASGHLTAPFDGGYAFTLRTDERIIPPSVVTQLLEKAEARHREIHGRGFRRVEKQEEREGIIHELAKTALPKTRYTHAYYHVVSGYLIVDTAGRKPAEEVAGRLLQVREAIKTTTLHVSVVRGLTAKLQQELGELQDIDDLLAQPFGPFSLGDCVKLKRQGDAAETVTYSNVEIHQEPQIVDQLRRGFRVAELRLHLYENLSFKLCEDFSLKAFSWPDNELSEADELAAEEDPMVAWQADALLQVAGIVRIADNLVSLLEVKDEESPEEAA